MSQCSKPIADACEEAIPLCSLSELNGFTCRMNTYQNQSGPTPLCPTGGYHHNMHWWAFVGQGGPVTMKVTTKNCFKNGLGTQVGVYDDCSFQNALWCDPVCSGWATRTINMNLDPCKIYYLFIDGCDWDACYVDITVSGYIGQPSLALIGLINDDPTRRGEGCLGECDKCFFVRPVSNGCVSYYYWTIDGVEFGDGSREACLPQLTDVGSFEICVTGHIGNSSSNCPTTTTQCYTLVVNKLPARRDGPRYVCWENVPFQWYHHIITQSGEYRTEFEETNCCVFDSIVEFIVKDESIPKDIYWIGCEFTDCYIDKNNKYYCYSCNRAELVELKKSTEKYRCDSSIIVHQYLHQVHANWLIECRGNYFEIDPNLTESSCFDPNVQPAQVDYSYEWLRRSTGQIFSTEPKIIVSEYDDYCLKVTAEIQFGPEIRQCVINIGCDPFDERYYVAEEREPKGDTLVECLGDTACYTIDTIFQPVLRYNWEVIGGTIIDSNYWELSKIRVVWDTMGFGAVCFSYETDCDTTDKLCIQVEVGGERMRNLGDTCIQPLTYHLNGPVGHMGEWTLLSGPGLAFFDNRNDPRTRVRVSAAGRYVFEWKSRSLVCPFTGIQTVRFKCLEEKEGDHPRGEGLWNNSWSRDVDDRDFLPNVFYVGDDISRYLSEGDEATWYDIQGRKMTRSSEVPQLSGIYILRINNDFYKVIVLR